MTGAIILWDLDDDPTGNVQHVAAHGLTKVEVEELLRNKGNSQGYSQSSGLPATFGWTITGKHIIVIWELVDDDPLMIYPVTAYEVPPSRRF